MFGRKKRKQRKAEEQAVREREAQAAVLFEAASAQDRQAQDETVEPAKVETGRADEARPIVALLTDGERLGFEPELHIPSEQGPERPAAT